MCDDNARSQPTCCGLPLGRKGLKFWLPSTPSLTVNRSAQSPSCPYACGRALRSERSCSETVDNWEIPGPGPEQLVASECDGMSLQQGQQEGWAYGLIFQHLFPLSSLLSTSHRGACCRCWGARPVEVVSSKHHWPFLRNQRQMVPRFRETDSCLSNGSCLTLSLCFVNVPMLCSEDRLV